MPLHLNLAGPQIIHQELKEQFKIELELEEFSSNCG